jgi:hypothetical protein
MKQILGVTLVCCAALGCNADSTEPGDKGGSEVTLDGLTSRTPAAWKKGTPASKMRSYQFTLPRADGDPEDAELVIFFFGKGGGGGAEENIKRWKGFFRAPDGKTLDDVSKVTKFKVGDVDVTYLDVSGTFLSKDPPFDPNAKEVKKADFRRFGVIFESPNGPYFITLTGPAKTMERHKKDFDDWLKNFK